MNKKKRFEQLCRDIKSIKIQGARNVALAGLKAYKMFPSQQTKNKILKLRATEPFLLNVLKQADELTAKQLTNNVKQNQAIINKEVFKLIKSNSVKEEKQLKS